MQVGKMSLAAIIPVGYAQSQKIPIFQQCGLHTRPARGFLPFSTLIAAVHIFMRLWSLHPKYLDPTGLVALWREALLAQKVLAGKTRGYQAHPQLARFRAQTAPLSAIGAYLFAVADEALMRGYAFDRTKIVAARSHPPIVVTTGQVNYEWRHLMDKLARRNPTYCQRWQGAHLPQCHPLFALCEGPLEAWERPKAIAAP